MSKGEGALPESVSQFGADVKHSKSLRLKDLSGESRKRDRTYLIIFYYHNISV